MNDSNHGKRRVCKNRHNGLDGREWGWVEEMVYIGPNPFCDYDTKTISYWHGPEEKKLAYEQADKHNDARARKEDGHGN